MNSTIKKKVVVLNYTYHCHAGTELVWRNIELLCAKYDLELVQCWEGQHLKRFEPNIKRQIQDCADMVIINGEGTLHHNTPVLSVLERLSGIKPTMLINTVWQANGDRRKFLDKVQFISVREICSWRGLVAEHNRKCPLTVGDLSLYSTGSLELPYNVYKTTGWQDSVLQPVTEQLQKRPNYNPMRQPSRKPNLENTLRWLSGVDFLVTGRFHGVCLAMMLKIPFVALRSNTYKIEGMLEDAGCSELLVSSASFDYGKMRRLAVKKIESNYNYGVQARKDIDHLFEIISS